MRCYQVIVFTVNFTSSLKLIYHHSTAHFGNIPGTIFHTSAWYNQDFSGLGIAREFAVEALQLSTQRCPLALLGMEAGLFSGSTNGLCLSRRDQQHLGSPLHFLGTGSPLCAEIRVFCARHTDGLCFLSQAPKPRRE